MTEIWVAEYEGGKVVRADSIYAVTAQTAGGDALVSVSFPEGTMVVARRNGVSEPGDGFDASAVRAAGDEIVGGLVRAFASHPQNVFVRILDWASDPWT